MTCRKMRIVQLLLFLGLGTTACESSLQSKDAEGIEEDRDGGMEAVVTVYSDEQDDRALPYQCEEPTECDDLDPCTQAACSGKRCNYTFKTITLTPTYIETGEPAVDVSIHGNLLLIATGSGGVEVHDISDPTDPAQRGHATTQEDAVSVEATSGGMYVSEGIHGIEGISFPSLDQAVFREPDNGPVRGLDEIYNVDLGRRYGFISGFSDGFLILDFQNLFSPSVVDGFNTSGRVRRVASDSEIAVVADALGGILVYGFDLEGGPDRTATILTEGRVMDIDMQGDTVVVAEYGEGFSLIDVSDMTLPKRLVDLASASPAVAARLMGPQTAVFGEENGRLSIIDVSLNVVGSKKDDDTVIPIARPIAPTQLGSVTLHGEILRMDVDRDLIAVALGEAGAAIITTGCVETEDEAEE